MMKAYIVLFAVLFAMIPNCCAQDFGSTFDDYLNTLTKPLDVTTNNTNGTDEGGSGDPFSGIRDGGVRAINGAFHTTNGWLAFYILVSLILTIVFLPFLIGGILGFVGNLIALNYLTDFVLVFTWIFFIIGFVIGLKLMTRSQKMRRLSKWAIVLLIIAIIALIVYLGLGLAGMIPWWAGGV
jgi:hypothetical protein